MSFCTNCGKEVASNEKFCMNCGSPNENYIDPSTIVVSQISTSVEPISENPTISILSIVFGVTEPLVGLIMAIIGLNKYKTASNLKRCRIGLGLSIGFLVLVIFVIILYIVYFAFIIALLGI